MRSPYRIRRYRIAAGIEVDQPENAIRISRCDVRDFVPANGVPGQNRPSYSHAVQDGDDIGRESGLIISAFRMGRLAKAAPREGNDTIRFREALCEIIEDVRVVADSGKEYEWCSRPSEVENMDSNVRGDIYAQRAVRRRITPPVGGHISGRHWSHIAEARHRVSLRKDNCRRKKERDERNDREKFLQDDSPVVDGPAQYADPIHSDTAQRLGLGMTKHWRRVALMPCVIVPLAMAASTKEQQRGPTVAERTLARTDFRWVLRRTPSANVYVLAGSDAVPLLPRLAVESERAITANLEWLGERRTRERLSLFFVGSRDEQRPFTGTRSMGWSIVAEGTAFFVANDSISPAIRHETMHLLSWRLWGTPGGVWMSEGLATAAVGGCRDWSIDEIASSLYRDRELATISILRRRFRTGGIQGAVHYLSAASLVLYIDAAFGREKLREMWRSGGLAASDRVLGVSTLELERRWRANIEAVPPPARWSAIAREINRQGCE